MAGSGPHGDGWHGSLGSLSGADGLRDPARSRSRTFNRLLLPRLPNQMTSSLPICVQEPFLPTWRAFIVDCHPGRFRDAMTRIWWAHKDSNLGAAD